MVIWIQKCFHLSTMIRRQFNYIESLQDVNGNCIQNHDQVKKLVLDYFTLGPVLFCCM